ncbi:MAG: sugar ABC transporter substrate-binding protein [Parasporobacterium sp.]|nr:sugar ABC transporter substrate-binding protein [Parasporobacterium sp.]
MKKIVAFLVAVVMSVMSFAGLAFAGEAEEGFTIGYNYFGPASYALLALANNSEYAIEYMGDTANGVSDNYQIEQIVADVENMCNSGCDGLIIWLPVEALYITVGDICAKYEVPFVLNDKIPQDPEILAHLQENPYYVGGIAPANAIYGEEMANYAIEHGYMTTIIATSTIGDPSDTPRLERFKEIYEAAGGVILDTLHCESTDDGIMKIENSLVVNDPEFIYGTGSDWGVCAVEALKNQDMEAPVLTSGLDSQALEYEKEGKIEMISGDFWVAGYFSAVLMEAYLHGNQLLDADGKVPHIENILPFEVPGEQYELYKAVFLDNHCYSQEETMALVNGTYEEFYQAIQDYSIADRAIARVKDGSIDAAIVEAAGITIE